MIEFKNNFLLLILSSALAFVQPSMAQKYIDIDLSPPKAKPPPKTDPATTQTPAPKKIATPTSKPKAAAKKAVTYPATKPAAKQVAQPTTKPVPKSAPNAAAKLSAKPSPKAAAVDEMNLVDEIKTPPPKPLPKPTPKPAPVIASPEPPQPAPVAEQPTAAAVESKPSEAEPRLVVPATPIPAPAGRDRKSRAAYVPTEDDEPRFKNRHAFTLDYTTWYETLRMNARSNKSLIEANTHYFGVAFSYDFTVYREKYGYAVSVGGVTGNAQAGTKDSGEYYERRIVWTGYRGGARLFFRANNRIDLGLGFLAQTKSTKWPEEEAYTVLPQSNPQYFYYLDTRWRLNYRYELVQAFGTHLRSYALAWMLGINYTLN